MRYSLLAFAGLQAAIPVSVPAQSGAQISAQQIVERADRIRFPSGGFQVEVSITSTTPDRAPDVHEYRVLAKGNDNSVVQTTAPASERGQVMLMKGSDLWIFLPNVSQPVRLPLSQRLTGQVANGDLARANFAGDYRPKLLRTETVGGAPHYVLELTANRRGVTYHRVIYWVHQQVFRPYKAEFYTRSRRLMKTASYEKYEDLGGQIRPTRLVMEDALRKGHRSVMDYRNMRKRNLPDKVFTKNFLKKLQ